MWIFQPLLTAVKAVTVVKTVSLQNFCNEQNTTWFCNVYSFSVTKRWNNLNKSIWLFYVDFIRSDPEANLVWSRLFFLQQQRNLYYQEQSLWQEYWLP